MSVECFANPERDPLWAGMLIEGPKVADGSIHIPETSGFGIRLDPSAIKKIPNLKSRKMPPAENLKGAIFMSINMLAFVVNDAFMKFLFIDISIYQAIFLRGIITIPMLALIVIFRNQIKVSVDKADWKYIYFRVVAEVGAAVFFLSALAKYHWRMLPRYFKLCH